MDTVQVGDRSITVPAPDGLVRVDETMPGLHAIASAMAAEFTPSSLLYIPESVAAADSSRRIDGRIEGLERFCVFSVDETTRHRDVTDEQFAETRRQIRSRHEEAGKRPLNRSFADRASLPVPFRHGVVVALASGDLPQVDLRVHDESDVLQARSSFGRVETVLDGVREVESFVSTVTALHVEGKVLRLDCFGRADDLDWTRRTSRAWAERLLARNHVTDRPE